MLRVGCLADKLCPQIPGYILNTAVILIVVYVVVDLIIPEFFTRILPRLNLSLFYANHPDMPDIRLKENQSLILGWLRDRLLWAFVVFCLYIVMILR
jgi:hypothetical protein